jgi:hypothetical protein
MIPRNSGNKNKNQQTGLHQIYKLLHIKGNKHQDKATAKRMGENHCELYM